MERTKYSDDVLDARMTGIDDSHKRLSAESTELRREMRGGFGEIRAEMAGLRGEMGAVRVELAGLRADGAVQTLALRGELASFRNQMMWLVGFLAVSLVSLLGVAVLQL